MRIGRGCNDDLQLWERELYFLYFNRKAQPIFYLFIKFCLFESCEPIGKSGYTFDLTIWLYSYSKINLIDMKY